MARAKESLGRRSARTFSVLTIGRIVALLIGIATIAIIARLLGRDAYGIYTVAYAFFALIGATNNFGYGSYLTKYLSEYEDRKDGERFGRAVATGFLSTITAGLLLTLFGMAISGPVASALGMSGVSRFNLMLAASILFFYMVYGTADHALIGIGMNTAAALLENAENVVLLAVSVFLVLTGNGVNGAIVGILVSYIFASIVGTYQVFWFARRKMHARIGWPSGAELKHAFTFSLPVAVNNFLSNAMVNVAVILLGLLVVSGPIGDFGVAKNARNVLAVFYGTAAVTLVPTLTLAASREAEKGKHRSFGFVYNKALLYSMISTVPIITYIGAFATPLVYFLVGKTFLNAPLYLALVALGTVISLSGIYVTSLFVAKGKTRQLLTYSAISAAAQLAALVLLIPAWGVLGAIVSVFFVGSMLTTYLFLRGARKVLGVATDYPRLLRTLMSNCVLALFFALGFGFAGVALQLAYGIAVSVVVYPVLLVALRAVDSEDVGIFEKAVKKLPQLRALSGPMIGYFKMLVQRLQGSV